MVSCVDEGLTAEESSAILNPQLLHRGSPEGLGPIGTSGTLTSFRRDKPQGESRLSFLGLHGRLLLSGCAAIFASQPRLMVGGRLRVPELQYGQHGL